MSATFKCSRFERTYFSSTDESNSYCAWGTRIPLYASDSLPSELLTRTTSGTSVDFNPVVRALSAAWKYYPFFAQFLDKIFHKYLHLWSFKIGKLLNYYIKLLLQKAKLHFYKNQKSSLSYYFNNILILRFNSILI